MGGWKRGAKGWRSGEGVDYILWCGGVGCGRCVDGGGIDLAQKMDTLYVVNRRMGGRFEYRTLFPSCSCPAFGSQTIQRTLHPAAAHAQHVRVDHRRGDIIMPQQLLNPELLT